MKIAAKWSDVGTWECGEFEVHSVVSGTWFVEVDGDSVLGVVDDNGVMVGDCELRGDGKWGIDDSAGNAPVVKFVDSLEDVAAHFGTDAKYV